MAVIGIPIVDVGPDPVELNVLVPAIPTAFGDPMPEKMRAVNCAAGTVAYIQLQFFDGHGDPVNLTGDAGETTTGSSSSPPYTVQVRFREAVDAGGEGAETTGSIINAAQGLVKVQIPIGIRTNPGVYRVEFGIFNDADELLAVDRCLLLMESSAWAESGLKGPPLLSDIRVGLKDSSPVESELLESHMWDVTDICTAIARTVQYWNTTLPPVGKRTTNHFPYYEIWMLGIQYYLFEIIEEDFRKNRFKFSAGGVTTDDKDRLQEYDAALQNRFQRFTKMLLQQKASLNFNLGYGWFG
jgi:hypothetical protein